MLLGKVWKCKNIEKRGFLRPHIAKFYIIEEAISIQGVEAMAHDFMVEQPVKGILSTKRLPEQWCTLPSTDWLVSHIRSQSVLFAQYYAWLLRRKGRFDPATRWRSNEWWFCDPDRWHGHPQPGSRLAFDPTGSEADGEYSGGGENGETVAPSDGKSRSEDSRDLHPHLRNPWQHHRCCTPVGLGRISFSRLSSSTT